MSNLLPCPFCGCEVKAVESTSGRIVSFLCPEDSGCRGTGLATFTLDKTLEEAIEAWNRRATPNQTGEVDRT